MTHPFGVTLSGHSPFKHSLNNETSYDDKYIIYRDHLDYTDELHRDLWRRPSEPRTVRALARADSGTDADHPDSCHTRGSLP